MALQSRPGAYLKNNPYHRPTFYYPSNLGQAGNEPYIIFQIRDGVAKNAVIKGTVALYMPPTIQVKYSQTWEDINFTRIGESMRIAQEVAAGNHLDILGDLPYEIGMTIAKSAAGEYTDAVKDLISQHHRKIYNPHMAVLYRGPDFRRFAFEFHMMATNEQESDAIKQIIYTLKYASHPSSGQPGAGHSRTLLYPDEFIIGLFSPTDEYLFKIGRCALTGMSVDYAGSGTPSFFDRTGAPVDIKMQLEFIELEYLTKEMLKDGY